MHELQQKILHLVNSKKLADFSLRRIGQLVGEPHPQKIKHHIEQLERKKLVKYDSKTRSLRSTQESINTNLISIPIVGSADCGPATIYAEQNIEGYLKISKKLIRNRDNLFALKAVGQSMDKANINGQTIEEGDYVIVDSKITPENKDYAVSIIDGVCNIKKLVVDKTKDQIVLVSESTKDFPPIYIHSEEKNYLVNGKVIQVIKKP